MLSSWLYEHGSVEADDGREIIGNYLGIPIIKGNYGIDYNFLFSSEAIRKHAPAFANAFEIGKFIVNAYYMPTYFAPPDEGEVYPTDQIYPEIGLCLPKHTDSELYSEFLTIQDHRCSGSGPFIERNITRRTTPQGHQTREINVSAYQGEPHSLTVDEYDGLVSLFSMACFNNPESFQL